jgi:hypothetical protein
VAPLHKQQPSRQSGLMGGGPSLETRPIASSALEAAAGRRAYHVLTNPSVFQIHDTACFPFSLINFLQSNLFLKVKYVFWALYIFTSFLRLPTPLTIYLHFSCYRHTSHTLTHQTNRHHFLPASLLHARPFARYNVRHKDKGPIHH